jgi:hypothetical protein
LVAGTFFVGVLTVVFFSSLLAGKTLSNIPSTQQESAPWQAEAGKPLFLFPQLDQADLYYPSTVLQTNAWRSGTIPLWNPYNLGGIPLLANGQAGVAYPVRIGLALVAGPLANHDLFVALHIFLSGLFMFLLLKELRLRLPPALLGATAWMFASWSTGLMQDEVLLAITAWLPAALLLIHFAARRRSWRLAAAAGIPLGLMALGGQLQLAAIAFGVCFAYAVALAVKPPGQQRMAWPLDWWRLTYSVWTLGSAGGLAAVTLLPSDLNVSQGGRKAASYSAFTRTHTIPIHEFGHVFSGGPAVGLTLFFAGTFVGVIPLLFAFVGCVVRRPGAALGRWLAIGVFLMAFGAPGVTWIAYHFVPGVSRLSSTGQAEWLFDFGVIVLGAIGLDAVMDWTSRAAHRWGKRQPVLATWTPRVAVLLAFVAVGGTAWQLMDYAWSVNPPFTSKTQTNLFFPTTPAIAAVQRDREQRSPTEPQRLIGLNAISGDESTIFGLEDADGYDSVVSNRVRSLWYVVGGLSVGTALNKQQLVTNEGLLKSGSSSSFITKFELKRTRFGLLSRVGVTTVVAAPADAQLLAANPGLTAPVELKPVYSGGDASVYSLAGSQPRAWVVHQADVVPSAADALRQFTMNSFDYRHEMVVEADQGLGKAGATTSRGAGPSTTAARDSLSANSTAFTVRSASPGWLVMADMYAPGWHVMVNGHSVKLLRADYTLRAVPIPGGRAQVALSYRPPGFILGIVASVLTVAGLVVIFLSALPLRRRRGAPRPADAGVGATR